MYVSVIIIEEIQIYLLFYSRYTYYSYDMNVIVNIVVSNIEQFDHLGLYRVAEGVVV